MTPSEVVISGQSFKVVHVFNEARVLIEYEGLYCLADQNPDGTWDLTGTPATPEETEGIKTFTASMTDTTIVTETHDP